MSEQDSDCLICGHRDHQFGVPYDDEIYFKPMCWSSKKKVWITDCPCRKHVSSNLEYMETIYDAKKNSKS